MSTTLKPRLSKLVYKFCAGGLPDNLMTEYIDHIHFQLTDSFEFVDGFELHVEPLLNVEAYLPDWSRADKSFPAGRPFEMKAYATKSSPSLELTAIAAKLVVPAYMKLLREKKLVEGWLPGFDFEEDQTALRWVAARGLGCDASQAAWIDEQVALFCPSAAEYCLAGRAGLLCRERAAAYEAFQLSEDGALTSELLRSVSNHYIEPPSAAAEQVRALAARVAPRLVGAPLRYACERLYLMSACPADRSVESDKAALQAFAGGLPVFGARKAWLIQQAEVHAPHCAHAVWATPRMVAAAVLKRWTTIESRFAAYTGYADSAAPNPLST